MGPTRATDSLTATLVALTFVTGIVDAATFLALGQVFSAMQTGNVIFLGFGIAGAAGAPAVPPLAAIAAFLAGGALAALVARIELAPPAVLASAFAIEVALLASAAIVASTVDAEPETASAYVLIALLSLAMGVRNTTARGAGDPNLATTVLNLTLIGVAAGASIRAASGADLTERALAIAAILAGALAGALMLRTSLVLAIATAMLITAAAGAIQVRERSRGPLPQGG